MKSKYLMMNKQLSDNCNILNINNTKNITKNLKFL